MARPLKENAGLTVVFSFRTTEEVAEKWKNKVGASGYSRSEFFRHAVEENKTVVSPSKTPRIVRPKKTQDEQRIVFLLAQLGNNVNQIAHVLNTAKVAGKLSPHLFSDVLEQLEELNKTTKAWMP